MEAIIVTSESDLRRLIQEIIREELNALVPDAHKQPALTDEGLMTRVEMARYLKISLVTLTDWVKRGLPCIRKGGRVLFQKTEVLSAIKGHEPKASGHAKQGKTTSSKLSDTRAKPPA